MDHKYIILLSIRDDFNVLIFDAKSLSTNQFYKIEWKLWVTRFFLRITRFVIKVIRPDYQKFCLRSTPEWSIILLHIC